MKQQKKNLRGLIIGCGSIGERHLYNLKRLGITNIMLCDQDKEKANQLAQKYHVQKSYEVDSALSTEPHFTFICTYPKSHLVIANECLDANSHIFIEKPIASDVAGVEKMLKRAESKKLQVAVGYNMRFHKGLMILKEYIRRSTISKPLMIFAEWGNNIKQWRLGLNYTNHYVLKKGGGIILDASHEYDYIRWLLDDEVKSIYCKTRRVTDIKTETESITTMTITFRKGTIANLILDYVRPQYERRCHIIGEKGDLRWEFAPKPQSWKKYDSQANVAISLNLLNGKKSAKNFTIKTNEMYVDEARNFIDSIICNKKPLVNGWEGLKTLQIGCAALASAKSNKPILL
jgi:predicted dehydrogenase